MKRFVILHNEFGIFLGSFLGLGFFSMCDCGGQSRATSFATRKDVDDFIEEWKKNCHDAASDDEDITDQIIDDLIDNLNIIEIDTNGDHATVEELVAAGVNEDFLTEMRSNALLFGGD